MKATTPDQSTRPKFYPLGSEIELRDGSGKRGGYFLPVDLYWELCYAHARTLFTTEELERARQQPAGHTLAEVLKHLSKL